MKKSTAHGGAVRPDNRMALFDVGALWFHEER